MKFSNPFDNQEITSYTAKTFGESVRVRRIQVGKSLRGLANEIGMSPVYLSDIERGNRSAPTGVISKIDYLSALANSLALTDNQKNNLRKMAIFTEMDRIKFMDNYFVDNPAAFVFLVKAIEEKWEDRDWKNLYDSSF